MNSFDSKLFWLKNKPIAHRGLHDGNKKIIENSISSIHEAINKNLPIEIDLQLSKDDIAVFHDSNLERLCGIKIDIKKISKKDFNRFKLLDSNDTILSLEEVLEEAQGKVPLLIEIKNFSLSKKIEKKLIKVLSAYKGEFAIQSFNPFSINFIKEQKPDWICGQLIGKVEYIETLFPLNYIIYFYEKYNARNLDFCAIDINALNEKILATMKKNNLLILAWTIKNKEQLQKAQKFADNIIFENIEILKI